MCVCTLFAIQGFLRGVLNMKIKLCVGFLWVLSIPFTISAAPVTFEFTGTINYHYGLASDLHTLVPIGQQFTGSYTFDPMSSPSGITSDTAYYGNGALTDFRISFGSLYANFDRGTIVLQNDILTPNDPFEPYLRDYYKVGATAHPTLPTIVETNITLSDYVSETIISGYYPSELYFSLSDTTGNMLNDLQLSTMPPDINGTFTSFRLAFQLDCCNGGTEISGKIESLTVSTVPIPAAVWLFGSGLIGLIGFARHKKSSV